MPAACSVRAITPDHMRRSCAVYPTTVLPPVVPEEAWTRRICSRGTANIPNGKASRKCCLVVNGNFPRSESREKSSGCTPAASKAAR
jgi:hypothetical protein